MRFAVLGALEVEREGRLLDLGTPKQRAVLARLLLDAPHPVSVDRLVEDLWSGDPPARASASLQAYVSNLRRVLEPDRPPRTPAAVLVTRPPGYLVRVDDGDLDSARFRALAAQAATSLADGDATGAHATALEALGLWRGPALLDVREEPFAAAAVRELEDLRLAVEETRLAAALDLGHAAQVAAELEALVEAEPLRERWWELLVVALYRAGRPAAALARYRRVRQVLDEELGLEPGPRLQELERAVLRHDVATLGDASAAGGRLSADGDAPAAPASAGAPTSAAVPASAGVLDDAGRPPLVGRDDLLETLTTAALGGAVPRWLVLTGDAGIGKSRLAETLERRAAAAGRAVATARCHDDPDTPSFWVWTQVLRALRPSSPTDPLTDVVASAGASGAGDASRFAVYDGIRGLLADAAAGTPLLVTVDDLQWADGDSLRALRFLAVHLAGPVTVVATVRDGEGGDLLEEVLTTVARQPGALRVAVPPLDADAVGRIAEAVSGRPVARAVVAELHARSAGNPFVATELARIAGSAGAAPTLPAEVRELVARRLDRMPDAVRELLAQVAVVGAEPDVPLLAAVDGVDVPTLLDRLDPALAAGVLVEADDGLRVAFAHALLREALLADLSPVRRRRVHAAVARALVARDTGGQPSPELAHHLVEAGPLGDLSAARAAARAVGEQALARFAYDEAARWFGRALDVARQLDASGPPDLEARYTLLLARGDALSRSGQVVSGRQHLAEAVEVAMQLDDLDGVARAAAALAATGGVWTWVDLGEVPPAVAHLLESVLEQLGDADSPARARLLSTVATGLYYGDAPERVDALSAEAVAVARRLGDPSLLADTLLDRAFALRLPERSAEVLALAEEALALPGLSDLQTVVAHGRRFFGLLHLGDFPGAVAAHRVALEGARRARLLGPQLQLGHLPAGVAAVEGRLDDAERLLAEAAQRDEQGDLPRLDTGRLGLGALIAILRGRLGEHVEHLRAFAEVVPMRPLRQILALAHLSRGDVEGARQEWLASRDAPDVPWLEVLADALEVEVREALAGPTDAPSEDDLALLALLRRREGMIAAAGTAYPWVPVGIPLAALEHRLGLLDDAEAHLLDVLARSEAWGTHTWTALALNRLGRVLADRGKERGAAEAADRAAALAHTIGLALPARPQGMPRTVGLDA